MFKDFKSDGFNLEDTWSMDIECIQMLYFCISIAYCFNITLVVSCGKDNWLFYYVCLITKCIITPISIHTYIQYSIYNH